MPMTIPTLGLDIGGANLKAAHNAGMASTRPFSLWKEPERLRLELLRLLERFPTYDQLTVTMTAELCDCFATKHDGVNRVLDAVAAVSTKPTLVWTNEARLVSVAVARRESLKTAAANWLALATFAGRFRPRGSALLIDVGSTTTDIVPLVDGVPVPQGRTDLERLVARELVYQGVLRTPVCALVSSVTWRERPFRPAAELFATTQDAYLLLGDIPENAEDGNTADGRPATQPYAQARLARMLCADADMLAPDDTLALARQVRQNQLQTLEEAVAVVAARMPRPPEGVILSGAGEFLAGRMLSEFQRPVEVVSLRERLGPEVSRAACAYALAVLASKGRAD
jgi:(4-(4-[2-(gamma-L-glutamylamino)ethyl]phenoxymethyl)furan-2-yl)methanamine synthase